MIDNKAIDTQQKLKVKDIAFRENVTAPTVIKWIEKGLLKASALPSRQYRIHPADYERFKVSCNGEAHQ